MTAAIHWKQITRNHWTAMLPGGVTIDVMRNRSWKAQRDDKPFKIEVFGNIWAQQHREGFAFLEQAQIAAEDAARKIVRGLVAWAAKDTFPKSSKRRSA
jgi:hypothetical protein